MSKDSGWIAKLLFASKGNRFPFSHASQNPRQEQRAIQKQLSRKGIKGIGVSTEPSKGLLWFWKKK